ncbi:MAG TPA: RNA polymerase subunit sigma-70 [Brevundimonas sp.]|nr:RNA polymerase subunit sigma-70 [Brevundimonas sp.]HAJ04546.1 RNA polymerase subunit sigma-70 [Brevundimonas sp.]HAV49761.1 RNA polymerase subunit sigma-70 [Brevundimonas sp.]
MIILWDETTGFARFIHHGRGNRLDEFQNGLVDLLPRLRRFARVVRSEDADAQDLVQQTVERALASRHTFRPGTRLDSWAFTIMRRIAIDHGRSARRWSRILSPSSETDDRAPDRSIADEDARADAMAMRDAIHRLPDDQRHAVALVLIEGLTYAEAAKVLGIPVGTLTSRLVRGRLALVETLSSQEISG